MTQGLQRLQHALLREDWLRDVRGRTYYERIDKMAQLWATLGMVEPRQTPQALRDVGFPEQSTWRLAAIARMPAPNEKKLP
ncbi:hypothetical protein ACVIIV_003348 [Bradyrhizobium sp. USDA 4354]